MEPEPLTTLDWVPLCTNSLCQGELDMEVSRTGSATFFGKTIALLSNVKTQVLGLSWPFVAAPPHPPLKR